MRAMKIFGDARRRLLLAVVAGALLSADTALAQRTVLRLWISGPTPEAPDPSLELQTLFGGAPAQTFYSVLRQIDQAADRDDIDGLVLVIDQPEMSLAQIDELSRAIGRVRAAGKRTHAYLENADNPGYLLACAADHITLAEHALLDIHGLRAQLVFYKGLLDWLGVEAELLTCGDYKTAVEPYTRTEPSMAATEQTNWLLDSQYERYLTLMAEGRSLDRAAVEAAVDDAPLFAQQALQRKLIDRVANFADFRQMLLKEYGADVQALKRLTKRKGLDLDLQNPFAFFQVLQDAMQQATVEPEAGVALIYVDGLIVPQVGGRGPFAAQVAGSTTIRAAIDEALRSDHIKAVVLRINSRGGSSLASDIIWKAARRLARDKPLIVSMGSVAGSGGYYIGCAGDHVLAEKATITGSIGVFGGKIVMGGLMEERLGVTTTEFTRGGSAGMMSATKPFSDADRAKMQTLLNTTYAQFKQRVETSRGPKLKGQLEELAGGRVYTGEQALAYGLVDQIGGLGEALDLAAERAGLDDPPVHILPKQEELGDLLARLFGQPEHDEFEINPEATSVRQALQLSLQQSLLDRLAPRQAAAVRDVLLSLTLLRDEMTLCWNPLLEAWR